VRNHNCRNSCRWLIVWPVCRAVQQLPSLFQVVFHERVDIHFTRTQDSPHLLWLPAIWRLIEGVILWLWQVLAGNEGERLGRKWDKSKGDYTQLHGVGQPKTFRLRLDLCVSLFVSNACLGCENWRNLSLVQSRAMIRSKWHVQCFVSGRVQNRNWLRGILSKNHMGTSDPKTVELAVRIVSYLAYSSLHLLLHHADDPDPGPDNEFNKNRSLYRQSCLLPDTMARALHTIPHVSLSKLKHFPGYWPNKD